MLRFLPAFLLFFTAFNARLSAQDTLPSISVKSRDAKVIISWQNNYGAQISNINIQRSTDSLKRFSTIGTVLNPMNRENGYVDSKAPAGTVFYRVFVAFEGGSYIFTKSHRPVPDTTHEVVPVPVVEEKKEPVKPPGPVAFVPSKFVFTGKDNNVIINLPNAATAKYSLKFFDEDERPLFEIRSIKEPYLILEKVNFLHAGWFKYHLFNNDILLEKYKFFIPKDGKNGSSAREPRNR